MPSRQCRGQDQESADLKPGSSPTGLLVGTAVISKCVKVKGRGREKLFEWHLTGVKRLVHPRKPAGRPQPRWFKLF